MPFFADLHVHSKYSRATGRDLDLEHLSLWAQKKGIRVVGTGDFTHPAWLAEIKEKLIPAENGLFRLRPDLEKQIQAKLAAPLKQEVRFMLQVEISTIYKKGDRTRKVHHVVYVPSLETADRFAGQLDRIGNIKSDGRPILGLDSRDLLEIVLESGEGSYLVPAHIWTPWFAALGSKSGFDSIDACYQDLASHIFAVETGLSSDPAMNWRVSSLNRFRLVSNSDAHSPSKLGREACVFDTELSYFAMRNALETGEGYNGTVEFFPEEGKYHLDGHRNCGIRLRPKETKERQGLCPECGKPVTIGVMHRVEELADQPEDAKPQTAGPVRSLIPLPEILSELEGVGACSKRVTSAYAALLARLGSEFHILMTAPLEEIRRQGSSRLAEALERLRRAEVIREAGYDGEYGVIRLFPKEKEERDKNLLLAIPRAEKPDESGPQNRKPKTPIVMNDEGSTAVPLTFESLRSLNGLDEEQHAAVTAGSGPILVVAGPGSGKTRTLAHRMAYLVAERQVCASNCLSITFSRRAAQEMRERLKHLLPNDWEKVTVQTFHGFALSLLKACWKQAGLQSDFRVAGQEELSELVKKLYGLNEPKAKRKLREFSKIKRTAEQPKNQREAAALKKYQEALQTSNRVDFDDLIILAVNVLKENQNLADQYQKRFPWILIDEYQDIDEMQYELVRLLVRKEGNLFAVGDANQAIYGFRGADVRFFHRFEQDFGAVQKIRLTKNYRSSSAIVEASGQVISSIDQPASMVAIERGGVRRITIHEAASEKAEAEFMVQTLEQLLGGHTFFSLDSGRAGLKGEMNLSFSDIAVLFRTEEQSKALVAALERSGIPFQVGSHEESTDPSVIVEKDQWDLRADRISLLTLHAAKGLEFSIVFIVGCEDGLLPLYWKNIEPIALGEERRLFYVGMTRAKHQLFLSWARHRFIQGKTRDCKPSLFLEDIKMQLKQMSKTRVRSAVRPQAEQQELF